MEKGVREMREVAGVCLPISIQEDEEGQGCEKESYGNCAVC
jgi:hypothetical protein